MPMRSNLLSAAAGLMLTVAGSAAAHADCYDVFGCSDRNYFRQGDLMNGPNCEFLWQMRNSIYKERGYCFNTQRGIAAFGNAGCQKDKAGAVPLNRFDRANAATLARADRPLACPR